MIKKRNTTFKSNVIRLVSGTGLAQIIGLAAAPILTRLYGPEAFGIAALFAAITGVLVVLACLRYELSIVLPKEDEEAANLLALSLAISVLVAALTVPVIWLAGDLVLDWINASELHSYLWLIPLVVFISGAYTAFNYWSTRTKHFTRLSICRVTSQITTTGGSLDLGFSGHATGGSLIIAGIAGQVLATAVLAWLILKDNGKFLLQHVSWHGMRAGLRRHRKFPIYSSWGALINAASWQLPVLMLGAFFSPAIVGLYSLGFRLIQMPMSLVGEAISQVLFQRMSEEKSSKEIQRLVAGIFRRLLLVGLLPSMVLMVIGADLFAFVFGENWREAGVYVQILAPWAVIWFISSPLSTIYVVQEKQKNELFMHGLIFVVRIVAIAIGGFYGDARLAIALFSLGGVLAYGCLIVQIFNYSGLRVSDVYGSIFRIFALSIVYMIPLMLIDILFDVQVFFTLLMAVSTLLLFFYSQRKKITESKI